MKFFKITYFLKPEAENIVMTVSAKSYEQACVHAKGYRKESFSCTQIGETEPWEDKQNQYERSFQTGKTATNVWKYIPAKFRETVTNAFADSDGYWIWLDQEEGGWVAYDGAEDCGMIHEYTVADLKEAIKTIRKLQKAN